MRIWHLMVAVLVAAFLLTFARLQGWQLAICWIVIASAWVGLGWLGVRATRKVLDRTRYARGFGAHATRAVVILMLLLYSAGSLIALFAGFMFLSEGAVFLMIRHPRA